MAFPRRVGVTGSRFDRLGLWSALLVLSSVAAQAQVTITVNTNRDLADPGDGVTSLREAITAANARPAADGDVLITFDPNVFPPNPGGGWTHAGGPLDDTNNYYDNPDVVAPTNDPNRIVVGAWELRTFPGWTADASGNPYPLPPITRAAVRIDAELDDNGISDVRLDLTDLQYVYLIPGFIPIPDRNYGLKVTAPSDVVIEGLDIRFGAPNPGTVRSSVPAVWFAGGTDHRLINCDVQNNVIAVETTIASGNQVFIGGISSGSNNNLNANTFAGVFCTGAGTTIIQNNTISNNGDTANTDSGSDYSGGVVFEGSGGNVLGGTVSGSRNTISSNLTHGVVLAGSGQNFVQNNAITNSRRSGIFIFGSGNNIIGGSATLSGNDINSNGLTAGGFNHAGIHIAGSGVNTVQGNDIGIGGGNGGAGIHISGDGPNRIGGTAVAARNTISQNGALNSSESKSGIDIRGNGDNIVENNHIGTNTAGSAASANVGHGIAINGTGANVIGGTQTASRNVISGNALNGIRLAGTGANIVTGNYIGLGADGSTDVGNSNNGMEITATASGANRIGGTSDAERNVIGGNGVDGITVNGSGANKFYGNYFGLAADGSTQRSNARHGISITAQAIGLNTIGGRAPGQRNVISGNGQFGISVEGDASGSSNLIQGNYVGPTSAADGARSNGAGGISVNAAKAQTIGGSSLGDGNVVSGNRANTSSDGIELLGTGAHVIIGNLIGAVPLNPGSYPQDSRLSSIADFRNGGAGILVGGGATGAIEIGRTGANEANTIVNNDGDGIQIAGSGNVKVLHNFVGAGLNDTNALAGMPNQGNGVLISGAGNNTVGGLDDNDPNTTHLNVVSGNRQNGISITGPGNNQVLRNTIGTNDTGTAAIANGDSLAVAADDNGVAVTGSGANLVSGNTISGNFNHGVYLFGTGTYTLTGNSIGVGGLDRTGTTALANGRHGVFVPNNAPGNLILGGAVATALNVISGNTGDGVRLEGNVSNTVQQNLIGTTAAGTAALGNGGSGVHLQGASTTITTLVDNVVSGNSGVGVNIISGSNSLFRNKIGTNQAGSAAVANGSHGISLNDPNLPTERQGQVIGKLAAGNVRESNIISGNAGDGVHITQAGGDAAGDADDVLIHTNLIGVDSTGLLAIPNGGDGVEVAATCTGKVQIGGLSDGQGNLISGNTGWGLRLEGPFTYNPPQGFDNTPLVYGNLIGTNVQGETALGNTAGGITIAVPLGSPTRTVLIGGTGRQVTGGVLRATNQIAGNGNDGIRIDGQAAVTILGCFIGTDSFGRKELPNAGDGISVLSTYTGALQIGVRDAADVATLDALAVGTLPTALQIFRNLISANDGYGIDAGGTGSATIVNNYLGAREDTSVGTLPPAVFDTGGGNDLGGVRLTDGATTAAVRVGHNVVYRSGGTSTGVAVQTLTPTVVSRNWVQYSVGSGINLSGTGTYQVLSNVVSNNGGDGVRISNATGAIIGAGATDASTVTGQNTIESNGGNGISVVAGSGNRLSGNIIRNNGLVNNVYNGTSLAIDLGAANGTGPDGVTLNDGATTSGAPNLLLDFPQLDRLVPADVNQADANATTWTVSGQAPAGTSRVELFQARDPQFSTVDSNLLLHHGQVERFLARLTVDGNNRFTTTLPVNSFLAGTQSAQLLICALAIDGTGNTSELGRNTGRVSLTTSSLAVNPGTIPADGSAAAQATATATVRDVIGTPLPGVPNVVLSIKAPTPVPTGVVLDQDRNMSGGVDAADMTTDANGQVTATVRADVALDCANPTANQLTLGATIEGQATNDVTLGLSIGTASTSRSTIAANPTANVVADGSTVSTLTMTVLDDSGAAADPGCVVPNVAVQVFQVVGGAPAAPQTPELTISGPANRTGSNGQTTATVSSTLAGTYLFGFAVDRDNDGTFAAAERVVDGGGALKTVSVTFAAGPIDAAGSTLTAAPTQVLANGSDPSTLTLRLVDSNGNPVVGVQPAEINLTAGPADGVVFGNFSGPTDATGTATVTVTGSTPGTVTFVATVRGTVLNQTAQVTFGVGAPSGASSLVATPAEARPNGTDQVLLTATVLDDSDPVNPNPIAGVDVTITPTTGTGVSVVGPTAPTNANGVTTAFATATSAGVVTFQATALVNGNPVVIGTAQVTFRLLDPDPAQSTLSVVTDDPLLANGQRRATVTVRLLDAMGDPIPGVRPDEFAVQVTPNTAVVSGPNDSTGTNGETTFAITSTVPGAVTARVTARGVLLNASAQATFLPSLSQSYGPGLHMMGVAGTPANPDPRQVLSSLLPNLQLARFDGGTQSYRVWNEFSPTAPFAMTAGRGFWLQLSSQASFTVVAEPTPNAPFQLPLARGWNQVANPFGGTWTFLLSQIRVRQNGVDVGSLDNAQARALVEPYGWRWDPVLQYLLLIDPNTAGAQTVSGNVGLGRGFWWLCRADGVTVVLQPPTAGRAVGRSATPTPGSWMASLEATSASGAAQAVFGAGDGRLRAELPPSAPVATPVEVAFVDGGRAASDIRQGPLNTRQRWTVEVTSREAGPVTVSWQGLGRALPASHKLWLTDPTNGQRVLMNSRASYAYTALEAGTRQLLIDLDPRGERRLEIAGVQAGTNRSRGAGIPVSITLTAPARITVTVKGLGGRLVRQFTAQGDAGLNALSWDGRDQEGRAVPAGNYQLEIAADGDDGELARAVRTISVR